VRPIDVGWLGSRHFLNIAGIGFDAAVASAFNRRSRRGPAGYVVEVLRALGSYRSRSYAIELDGIPVTRPRFLIAFANAPQYGTGLVISPDADPADGALNLVMVDGGWSVAQLWRARRNG